MVSNFGLKRSCTTKESCSFISCERTVRAYKHFSVSLWSPTQPSCFHCIILHQVFCWTCWPTLCDKQHNGECSDLCFVPLSCMDPSIAIKPVFQRFQSVVITSGVRCSVFSLFIQFCKWMFNFPSLVVLSLDCRIIMSQSAKLSFVLRCVNNLNTSHDIRW